MLVCARELAEQFCERLLLLAVEAGEGLFHVLRVLGKELLDEGRSLCREMRDARSAIGRRVFPLNEALTLQSIDCGSHGATANENFFAYRVHGEWALVVEDLKRSKVAHAKPQGLHASPRLSLLGPCRLRQQKPQVNPGDSAPGCARSCHEVVLSRGAAAKYLYIKIIVIEILSSHERFRSAPGNSEGRKVHTKKSVHIWFERSPPDQNSFVCYEVNSRRFTMDSLFFHPKVVHVPIALGALMPLVAGGLLLAWWRKWLPSRSWAIAVALQGILVLSGVIAIRSGEEAADVAEKVIEGRHIGKHADAAEAYVWTSGGVFVLMLVGLALSSRRSGQLTAAVAAVGTVVVLGLGVRAGEAGGELVYRYGACKAYISGAPGAETPAPKKADHDD